MLIRWILSSEVADNTLLHAPAGTLEEVIVYGQMNTLTSQSGKSKLEPLTGILRHSDACHIVTMKIGWQWLSSLERKSSKAIACALIEENLPHPSGYMLKLRP
jgi:hypothetical protein